MYHIEYQKRKEYNTIMYSINTKTLLFKVLIPTSLLSLTYLVLGCLFQKIPYLLLFCILGTVILVPVELGMILSASKIYVFIV